MAKAGVFEVRSCASLSTSSFVLSNSGPGTISGAAHCPVLPQTLLSGLFAVPTNGKNTPHGQGATWRITAPPGLKLDRLDVRRSIGTRRDAWKVAVRTGEGRLLETCELAGRLLCQQGDPYGDASAAYRDLNTQSVSFSMWCDTDPDGLACPGRELAQAWIAVYSAVALVHDPSPPVIETLSGPALSAGWHTGVERLDITASDVSGIQSIAVSAGSTTLFQQDQACDYARMQPCPATKQAKLSIDTSRLPDGTHELKVAVADAAAQPTVSTSLLRVDRTAPAPPEELVVERNPDGTIALHWKNPAQGSAAPIAAARYTVCEAASPNCAAEGVAATQDVASVASLAVPGGEHIVKVWLQDEAGNADPANVATLAFDPSRMTSRTVNTNPPVLTAGPAPSPRLRITRARRSGSTLTVSGTIARAASARIEAQVSRSRTGKPVLAKARVKPKRGKWTARVKLPRSLRNGRAMYLAVKYAGQSEYRATTLRRRLTEKPGRVGRATDEFSLEARGKAR